jgi:hypothetical protein
MTGQWPPPLAAGCAPAGWPRPSRARGHDGRETGGGGADDHAGGARGRRAGRICARPARRATRRTYARRGARAAIDALVRLDSDSASRVARTWPDWSTTMPSPTTVEFDDAADWVTRAELIRLTCTSETTVQLDVKDHGQPREEDRVPRG